VVLDDARVLWQLLRGAPRTGSQAERLEAFYAPQARRYDAFRERLLQGRAELLAQLAPAAGSSVVELGGGTGRNLQFFGDRLMDLGQVFVVDLCPALLSVARQRFAGAGHVTVIEADATTWQPPRPVDTVYFSYSLTMMPDWRESLDNAERMLAPGGKIGVVDFFVSGPEAGPAGVRHGRFTRSFWPRWFRHDGVDLEPARLATLTERFPSHALSVHRAPVPYLGGLTVPYYVFVGVRQRA
jgi:S-adenosylmethionine-diacylgycerolhomoserine-N-methlytransferase